MHMPDMPVYPGTPRWVKVFGAVLIALILLLVLVRLTGIGGRHGPGRHLPSGTVSGEPLPSSAIEDHVSPEGGH
ncbi:MAG: hypothetical protein GEU90_00705 [Gemmatimonas sp.]|nr:hypothetical protein [Gemmatimonas sp.]